MEERRSTHAEDPAVEKICGIVGNTSNIRNIAVIARVDHGRHTTVATLVSQAGLSLRSSNAAGGPNIDHVLHHTNSEGDEFLFKLDFCPEGWNDTVSPCFQLADGALVVVDTVEGACCPYNERLEGALRERVKPVLFLNKIDRLFLELQMAEEDIYQLFVRLIDQINIIIECNVDKRIFGDLRVSVEDGSVVFGSALFGWGFSVPSFAKRIAAKNNCTLEKAMKPLWGENYFDPDTKKWCKTNISPTTGKVLHRGFCQVILRPIAVLLQRMMTGQLDQLSQMLKQLKIYLKDEEKSMTGRHLIRSVMPRFLPLNEVLLPMMVQHLPCPAEAQLYRMETFYTGASDNECSLAMGHFDKDGPLMIFITHSVTKDGKKYAYGRVYSGTVRAGEEVRVLGPNAKADDEGVMRCIEKVGIPVGNTVVEVDIPIPCGNIVCLLIGDCEDNSTISNSKNAVPFRTRWSDEQRDDITWAYQYHHIEDLFSGEKYI